LILGGLLVATVALVWIVPAVAGPTVDCGEFDQATCDRLVPRVVAEAIASGFGPPVPMPVRSVWVSGPSEFCVSYQVWWFPWVFGYSSYPLC
jgi:hypothetical protein